MTGIVLVAASLAVATVDWYAVARRRKRIEYAFKPLALVVMTGAAVALGGEAPERQWAFTVIALMLSLAGDVYLMLPRDMFVAGLASFLLAHVAYVIAFDPAAARPGALLVAASVSGAVAFVLFARLRRGLIVSGRRTLVAPVAAYVVAITAMFASAAGTLSRPGFPRAQAVVATVGAAMFMVSDALIGWSRFVKTRSWMPVAIIVTYHAAQALLVLSLVRGL
jgi:uncharacterized membrane protein YhhN